MFCLGRCNIVCEKQAILTYVMATPHCIWRILWVQSLVFVPSLWRLLSWLMIKWIHQLVDCEVNQETYPLWSAATLRGQSETYQLWSAATLRGQSETYQLWSAATLRGQSETYLLWSAARLQGQSRDILALSSYYTVRSMRDISAVISG